MNVKVPTEMKPHFGVVIMLHIVCSVCVGVLLILVHEEHLFRKLDPFRLILLSLVLTTPLTAICFSLLFVVITIFKRQSLKAGNVDTAAHSSVAAIMSLFALTCVSVGRFYNWWTTPGVSVAFALIIAGILFVLAICLWKVRKGWWEEEARKHEADGRAPLKAQVITHEEGEIEWVKTITKRRHKPRT